MNICLIHGKRKARAVLTRALSSRLGAEVVDFSCCEGALASPLDYYDVFVVYNNFRGRMGGVKGVAEIRAQNPDAFIVGVSSPPGVHKRVLSAGADAWVLRAGNEVVGLTRVIQKNVKRET